MIDIKFEPHIPLEVVRRFAEQATPHFEKRTELFDAFFGFTPDGSATTANQTLTGWRLDCQRTHYVLMCRVDSFTVSRLSPYGRWEELREEASKWWNTFLDMASPSVVTRVAVRYVNAIKLPLPLESFEEYLSCPPRIPNELPQAASAFIQRVVLPDEARNCTSVVTQALEESPVRQGNGDSITVLLDIDVFRSTRIERRRFGELWGALDELRDQKNRLFFSHLTEKTLEMFI
ncbi:hypothetical protein ABE85_22315 [Mitsuaria sp. 7]|nr:hypothetical protein ABE85_22315 [Mitsuaria sp. 7]